eukprot:1987962-Pleurochrysis_carterae.AAC.1
MQCYKLFVLTKSWFELRFPQTHDITVVYVWVFDLPITVFEWRSIWPSENVVSVSVADSAAPQASDDVVEIVPIRLLLDEHNRETITSLDRTVHERTDGLISYEVPCSHGAGGSQRCPADDRKGNR